MAQNVHHLVLNKRGYHRLKLEPYFWRGYVHHCDQFFDKRPNFNEGFLYTKKNSTVTLILFVINLFFGSSQTANWLLGYGSFKFVV